MPTPQFSVRPLVLATLLALPSMAVQAQTGEPPAAATPPATTLSTVNVNASADASAEGLPEAYAGGQVAKGGRVGILGNVSNMDSPFSSTSYTNELIQDQQAQSVADVLLNDPSVRQGRGFGNFQELYMVRGFPVYSDDVSYNGLYGMMPRQYIASEFFERVEVFRGPNTFLNGAAPAGSGVTGGINLLPKRAGNEPLTRVGLGIQTGGQTSGTIDLARRFGPDQSMGIRVYGARRDGGTGIDREDRSLTAMGLGLDWRSSNVRVSADVGYQENKLKAGRPNVTPASGLPIPKAPDSSSNFAQPWTYSSERTTFATVRGEVDLNDSVTAWAAAGMRRGRESNSLANPTVLNAAGDTSSYRFDNERKDAAGTGEIGLRAKLRTGSVGHTLVASAATFASKERNAYAFSDFAGFGSNLYSSVDVAAPTANYFTGGVLSDPRVTQRVQTYSVALADTLSFMDDRLLVTAGLRRQTLKQNSYNYDTGIEDGSKNDQTKTTPVAGIVFKATKEVSLYANYIESLVRGDVAAATSTVNGTTYELTNKGQAFAPYVGKQKEVGVKYDAGRIGGGISLFTVDKKTSMVTVLTPPVGTTPGTALFGANGEQRNRGIEFSVYGEPVRGVRVLGGLTLLDAVQKQTSLGLTDGKDALGVPKQQLNVGAEWDIPGVRNLAVNGRLIYTSKQYADAANTQPVSPWTRFDIGARYLVDIGSGRTMTLRARIDNLFDRSYWASVGGYPGQSYLVAGAPRTFVLNATIDF